jgi:hypothetical protein
VNDSIGKALKRAEVIVAEQTADALRRTPMTNPVPTPHPPNDLAAPGDLVGEDGSIYMASPAPEEEKP